VVTQTVDVIPICTRQGSVAGAGNSAGLLRLGETGKGCVVGLLVLHSSGAGLLLGSAGIDVVLLSVGEGDRDRGVDESTGSSSRLGQGRLCRRCKHGAARQGGQCMSAARQKSRRAGATRQGAGALIEQKRGKSR
jgi:hypothetical protein